MPKSKKPNLDWEDRERFLDAHAAGDLAAVKRLLAKMPAIESVQPNAGTWIHQAAQHGQPRLIQIWLDRGLKVDQNVPGYGTRDGLATPLTYARNDQVVRFLLK